MELRRETSFLFLSMAFDGLLFVFQIQWHIMPDWIFYSLVALFGIVIIVSIVALTPLWNKVLKNNTTIIPSSNMAPNVNYDTTVRIKSEEPNNHPPIVYYVLMVLNGVLIFAFGVWIITLAIVGNTWQQVNANIWLIFFLISVVFPIWMIVDIMVFDRRQRKLGKSHVAKEKTIDLKGDANTMFDRCWQVIHTSESSIIIMEKPKLIKARWRNSIMTVTVANLGHGSVRVRISSDSRWVTTRWDFGKNQKNVDTFDSLLHTKTVN